MVVVTVCCLLLAIAASGVDGVSQANIVAEVLPRSDARIRAEQPVALACKDGAVWLFWWQGVSWERYQDRRVDIRIEQPISEDLGVFCRLVAADGADILGPRRLVKPRTWSRAVGPLVPWIYSAELTPEGGALLFLNDEVPGTRGDSTVATEMVAVDRAGRVKTASQRIRLRGGPTGVGRTKFDGESQCCWSHAGRLLGLTYSVIDRAPAREFEFAYFAVDLRQGKPVLSWTRHFKFVNETRNREFVRTIPTAWDHVRRIVTGWTYWAMAEVGADTLVLVSAPPAGAFDRSWGRRFPGDSLFICRVRSDDLALIDSFRVDGAAVASSSTAGPHLPKAVLLATQDGLAFALPTAAGNTVYHLDRSGHPVAGVRLIGDVLPMDSCPRAAYKSFSFERSTSRYWTLDCFGITDTGSLCHAASSVLRKGH